VILDPIKPRVLAERILPNADEALRKQLDLAPHQISLGLLTCTIDDCLYAALDEGTKAADVDVVFAKSFYAGSAHASGPFSGEILGIFAAPTPEEIISAMRATVCYLEEKAWFFSANPEDSLAFFPHVIPSVGRYLARVAGVPPGTSMAYLIAPPMEAMLGLDAALKAARVKLQRYYAPPTETNFAGGLLVGAQTDCEAAALAFQTTVLDLAKNPHRLLLERDHPHSSTKTRFRLHETGEPLTQKPPRHTHLYDDQSLVPKQHPIIRLRGKLDSLQSHILDAQLAAKEEGHEDLARDIGELLDFVRRMLAAEVAGRPCPELSVGGLSADELHTVSHHTREHLGVGFLLPDISMGKTAIKLNLLRAYSREVELAAEETFSHDVHVPHQTRERMLHGLNRLSNAVYVLTCKVVGKKKHSP
jgi:ethanolamine utilization protein EutL